MGFKISPSDRVSIVGKTGSGKTYLARRLLAGMAREAKKLPFYYPIIILDNKGRLETFRGFGKRIRKLKALRQALVSSTPIITYSPEEGEQNEKYYTGFFDFLYNLNMPMLVYVDELALVGTGNDMPESYEKFMKQGRERMQSLWAATQNPVFVAHDFFSNADHFFIFDLLLETDRNKMAAFAGAPVKERPEEKHGFWYFSTNSRNPEYFSNKLDTNKLMKENETRNLNEDEGGQLSVKTKWIMSILVLGLVMVFVLPLWKKAFQFMGEKIPATAPIANFTQEA